MLNLSFHLQKLLILIQVEAWNLQENIVMLKYYNLSTVVDNCSDCWNKIFDKEIVIQQIILLKKIK